MGNIKEDIIKMIDGELSKEQSSEVLGAINQSPELQSFYEAAKQSTSSLQSYFGSEEVKEANVRLKEFIDSKATVNSEKTTPDKKRPIIDNDLGMLEKLSKIFSFGNPAPLYLTAAVLAFSLGLNFYLFNETNDQALGLIGYSSEMIERNEPKYRGIDDSYERIFKKVLLEMHKEKNSITKLDYGSETFQIELHKLIHEIDTLVCYEGEIKSTDQKSNFVFCLDQEEQTNTFIMSSSD